MSDAEPNKGRPMAAARPLSPHLTNYALPMLPITSILGRITGVGLAIGTVLVTWWLVALASGPEAYAVISGVFAHPLGMLVLFAFTVSLFYHMCKGVRQFVWDTGRGLDVETAERMSLIVFAASIVLSVGAWAFILLG